MVGRGGPGGPIRGQHGIFVQKPATIHDHQWLWEGLAGSRGCWDAGPLTGSVPAPTLRHAAFLALEIDRTWLAGQRIPCQGCEMRGSCMVAGWRPRFLHWHMQSSGVWSWADVGSTCDSDSDGDFRTGWHSNRRGRLICGGLCQPGTVKKTGLPWTCVLYDDDAQPKEATGAARMARPARPLAANLSSRSRSEHE